ncbi:MAG: glycosyltransferase [Thermodesulfovibrio sp.]|uniref:glycosyltransferase family protein n=1 Tax=unclassified Thermodesulfovibrio TaxID=2645936 RepID=UPI00083A6280|nr:MULTISPECIES: glycosyltransferase [unclassified Thermodesulfovibrio]MDI1471637.1 glycosyltransferase [Thermodesulfovibrio sp. 1176]MDI6714309.1 glycosyltransferase [Thermodesulfovibrio sp.]ODA43922.1 Glycosyltransferase [Thermodesulfovibrio sp. N1]
MKILFILSQTPYPWWFYGRTSYYFTLISLRKYADVHVSFPTLSISKEDLEHLNEIGLNVYPYILDTRDKYHKILLNFFEAEPFKIRKYWDIRYKDFIVELTKKLSPDIIQIHTPHMAPYGIELKKNFPNIPIIIRIHDIVSEQIKTYFQVNNNPIARIIASWQLKKTESFEVKVWSFFEKTIFFTKTDMKKAISISLNYGISPENRFMCIMDGVDIKENLYLKSVDKENSISLAASGQIQNVLSLRRFLDEVWFKIYKNTSFVLNIYGKVCQFFKRDEKILNEKKVYLKGFIEDRSKLDFELAKSKIFLSYTVVGSGYRTKIFDAGAIGMPVICNSFDFEPLSEYLQPGKHILVADSKEDFLKILRDIEEGFISLEEISKNFHLKLKEQFSWQVTAEQFINLYNQLK